MCRWEGLRKARLIELQATRQLLVYTRHIDSRAENVHTVKKGVEAVLVASKEVSVVVTAGGRRSVVHRMQDVALCRLTEQRQRMMLVREQLQTSCDVGNAGGHSAPKFRLVFRY